MLSDAVVIYEITGQLKHTMPTLSTVLVSVIVPNGTLIIMKVQPHMAHMRCYRVPENASTG